MSSYFSSPHSRLTLSLQDPAYLPHALGEFFVTGPGWICTPLGDTPHQAHVFSVIALVLLDSKITHSTDLVLQLCILGAQYLA